MSKNTHKDIEFAVNDASDNQHVFSKFNEAAGFAVTIAASTGLIVNLDVLCYSKAGARAYGGDDGVEQYNDDPDASVFERIVIKAENHGRVA